MPALVKQQMQNLPSNTSYQIIHQQLPTNGDNEVQIQTAQNKLSLPGVTFSRYVSLIS